MTSDVALALQRDGFAVLDGLYGEPLCAQLRREVLSLRACDKLRPNASVFVAPGGRQQLVKRGVWEAEAHLMDGTAAAAAPTLRALSADRTLLLLLSVLLPSSRAETLTAQVLKVQLSEGGAFPMHCDSDESLDGRRWTAISYLNPGYAASDGGQLVLYPLPRERVVLEPRNDRLVLFSASSMLHRVLPSRAPQRVCFTQWLFARETRGVPPSVLPTAGRLPAATEEALLSVPLRSHTTKAALRDEWALSLKEAHLPSEALEVALAALHRDAGVIERALAARFEGSAEVLAALRKRCGSGSDSNGEQC